MHSNRQCCTFQVKLCNSCHTVYWKLNKSWRKCEHSKVKNQHKPCTERPQSSSGLLAEAVRLLLLARAGGRLCQQYTHVNCYVYTVSFSAPTLLAGWQKGHLACKKSMPCVPKGSLLEQGKEENRKDTSSSSVGVNSMTCVLKRYLTTWPYLTKQLSLSHKI